MRIRQLTSALANQIAAGEVVERPASVAKELVENSLDAGASKIEVEVENGGLGVIRVRDDGHGIHRDDLVLALARHATSKLRSIEDLQAIRSLGFRGEALPSIASVARLEIQSRFRGADAGWQLKAEGAAQWARPVPSPHPVGTSVAVRDLFFNTPGRRKFVRTRNTEFRHLEAAIKCVALSRFDVDLVLRHDARTIFTLPRAGDAGQRDRRVARICGADFLEHALYVELESGDLKMWGWVASPAYHRGQGDLQYLFVNGRPVRDGVARHAIRHAYGHALPAGRQPAYVVYLELDPGAVDVNVHPTKQEVRFREARLVHDFLSRAVVQALSHPDALSPRGSSLGDQAGPVIGAGPQPPSPSVREPPPRAHWDEAQPASVTSGPRRGRTPGTPGEPLGPLHGGFLLVTRDARLLLVDVARARRWLLSRRMRDALRQARVPSRPLLLPESIPVTESLANRVEGCRPALETLGFRLHRTGPEAIVVRELPVPFADVDPRELVRTLLAVLEEDGPDESRPVACGDERALAASLSDALVRGLGELASDVVGVQAREALSRELQRAWDEPGPPENSPAWVEVSPEQLRRFFDELVAQG